MYFRVWQNSTNKNWYWTLFAANHRKIADGSEGYVNKQDCVNMVYQIKVSAAAAPVQQT